MRGAPPSIGRLVIFILLGLVIGGVLGESLGLLLGQIGEMIPGMGSDNLVRNFFIKAFELDVGIGDGKGILVDLYMLKFRLGFALKFNVVSLIGMIGSLYIMKWSGER